MTHILTQCPNCGSIWAPGSEEWDFQECDCCGYPDNMDPDDYIDEEYSDEAFMEDDPADNKDPNDSRNL